MPPRYGPVSKRSSARQKIALLRSLFRGREDVYPKRWENAGTGKAGHAPACANEWAPRICEKPRVKCGACPNQAFPAMMDEAIDGHLRGRHTIGVYPMLADDTCRFLAADFDKEAWRRDANAFLEACRSKGVPAALERSRSGNGGHVWIFFAEPVPAAVVRRLGAHLVTETMERNPDIGFESYDRFCPSQDTVPTGGFGNLIALPLQHGPREGGNSLFLNDGFEPHADQWAFLSSLRRLFLAEVTAIADEAGRQGRVVLKSPGIGLPGLQCRAPHRFIKNINATFSEQIFDVPVVEGKPEMQPDSVLDNHGWKSVSRIGDILHPETFLRQQQQVTLSANGHGQGTGWCDNPGLTVLHKGSRLHQSAMKSAMARVTWRQDSRFTRSSNPWMFSASGP